MTYNVTFVRIGHEIISVVNLPSIDSRRSFVSYWRKYLRKVLVKRLRGLNLSRKKYDRLTDRHDINLIVLTRP